MHDWDIDSLNQSFFNVARNAEIYLEEVKNKTKINKSYESVYDDHLAKFYVYNYLHGKTFLVSRQALVDELTNLASLTLKAPHDAYDPIRFESCRQNYIRALIERFTAE